MVANTDMNAGMKLSLWLRCQHCHLITYHPERFSSSPDNIQQNCSVCDADATQKVMYFENSLSATLQFIQRAYESKQNLVSIDAFSAQATDKYPVSIVIFFAILQDLLLDRLLRDLAEARGIPKVNQLLAEHPLYAQKKKSLFPRCAGIDWDIALSKIQPNAKYDFFRLDQTLQQLTSLRQRFIYLGFGWHLSHKEATDCINSVEPLINLHVLLHNRYVHPCYLKTARRN